MRSVLDTDVIVAGLRSTQGASRQLLRLLASEQLVVVASVPTMLEYEAVLKRPENLRATNLSTSEIDEFLDSMAGMIVPVSLFFFGDLSYVTQRMNTFLKPPSTEGLMCWSLLIYAIFERAQHASAWKCCALVNCCKGSENDSNQQLCTAFAGFSA